MSTQNKPFLRREYECKSAVHTIGEAIRHIKDNQETRGNFLSLSSALPADFSSGTQYSTTFFTSNILACLSSVLSLLGDDMLSPAVRADIRAIADRAADFLLLEKSPRWSFNYFSRGTYPHGASPYPDDLDDTFAALAALQRYRPDSISGDILASATKLLINLELRVGGPYRTWVVPPDTAGISNTADVVVNSTIGYFLSLTKIHPSRILEYLSGKIREKGLSSPYYPGPFQAAYFISRYYATSRTATRVASNELVDRLCAILEDVSRPSLTPLESAMFISTCFYCDRTEKIPSHMANKLVSAIGEKRWQPHPFCIDPSQNNMKFYAGASALTAAFVAEALARCIGNPGNVALLTSQPTPTGISFHRTIQNTAISTCRTLPKILRFPAIKRIKEASDASITAPSYDLANILKDKNFPLPNDLIRKFSLAGLYGWLAYDIYDDILDGEKDPASLPTANYFSRKLTQIYSAFVSRFPACPIPSLFDESLQAVDAANTWEMTHCRILISDPPCLPEGLPSYGNYGELADKSIGYAVGPLSELLWAGHSRSSSEYQRAESLFRHYLVARQLHDDAHDWEDDLMRGYINSIAAMTIKKYRARFPNRACTATEEGIRPLREFFWEEAIGDTVDLIRLHIKEARRARESSVLLADTDFMESALLKLERSAAKALAERNRAKEFLKHFQTPNLL